MDDNYENEYCGLDPHDLDLLTRFHPLNKFPSHEFAKKSSDFNFNLNVEETKPNQQYDVKKSESQSTFNESMVEEVGVASSGGGSSKKRTSKGRGQKLRIQEDDDFIARQIRECIGSDHKGSGVFSGGNGSKTTPDRPSKEKTVGIGMAGVAHSNVGRKVARGRGRGKMKIEIV